MKLYVSYLFFFLLWSQISTLIEQTDWASILSFTNNFTEYKLQSSAGFKLDDSVAEIDRKNQVNKLKSLLNVFVFLCWDKKTFLWQWLWLSW